MYPIIFSIGGLNIYTHGLMMALGAIFGGFIIWYLAKKERLATKFLFDVLIYSLLAGIIGSRIVYVILYYYQFSNWHEMFFLWYGGLVSYGGIFFGFLAAALVLKRFHQNILQWFDIGIIGLFLGWAFGRVGCLLAGDVPGMISSSKIAIRGQIPVSLFEAIWSLVLAAGLLYLFFAKKDFLAKFNDGLLFFLGLAGYALGRFVIDFYRQESIFFLLKGGQVGSLIILVIILFIIYFAYLKPYTHSFLMERRKDV